MHNTRFFANHKEGYQKFLDKIIHVVVDDYPAVRDNQEKFSHLIKAM